MRVLYASGSIGLGHVTRDLSVARELRILEPDLDLHWLAGSPASDVLASRGEVLVPECARYRSETGLAEAASREGRLSLTAYVYRALRSWLHNAAVLGDAARRLDCDAIIGNETYEVIVSFVLGRNVLPPLVPFVMMYDFYGMEVTTRGLLEKLGAWGLNFVWARERRVTGRGWNAALFFGEPEDVPDRRFGLLLPNRRRYSRRHLQFVGYPLTFDPAALPDRAVLRAELGYGPGPLVVCTIGGTAVGRSLLELCGRAFPELAGRFAGLRMVLVCGPRIDPAVLDIPSGPERRGLVPDLYKHLACADLAVVQGGGTTTLETTALGVPFLFFPVRGQSEQEVTIASRLERQKAGVRMDPENTTPSSLAEAIAGHIGRSTAPPVMRIDGARRAAEIIRERVRSRKQGAEPAA